MVKEGPQGDPSREAKYKEFCKAVDDGFFDETILGKVEAISKDAQAFSERMANPTTPEDLIQSVTVNDIMKQKPGYIPPEEVKELLKKIEENMKRFLSLPKDLQDAAYIVSLREDFKKDPINFEKFLKNL